jgi:hypothetical protein
MEEAARRDGRGRLVMARLAKRSALDRSFDLEFWSAVGAEGRFAATWEMVSETAAMRGKNARELRLQRSVFRSVGR